MRVFSLIAILFCFYIKGFCQDLSKLNGFKFVEINQIIYEGKPIDDVEFKEIISQSLKEFGLTALYGNYENPISLSNNPCLGLKLTNYFSRGGSGTTPAYFSKLSFVDCNGKLAGVIDLRHQSSYKKALLKALSKLNKMKFLYNSELTPVKN